MSLLLIAFGAVGLLLTSLAYPRRPSRIRTTAAIAAALSLSVAFAPTVVAEHTVITKYSLAYYPTPWNGYKVYLSSPRHASSGSRGECGWEENINGRNWNMFAAVLVGTASFSDRNYRVTISPNNRVDGAVLNKDESNNWAANVHIVTHTNAFGSGCPNSAKYLLVMYRSGVSHSSQLRNKLLSSLDPVLPGGQNTWDCDGLVECTQVNASWRAYVELFFHSNQTSVNWFQAGGGHGDGVSNAWRYGTAVDQVLGYPR